MTGNAISQPPAPPSPPPSSSGWSSPSPVPARSSLAPGETYAGFWIRLGAYLIDTLPIAIVAAAINTALGTGDNCVSYSSGSHCTNGGSAVGSWLALLVLGVYWVITWTRLGASLGQRALGMRVVDARTGSPLTTSRAIVRFLGFVVAAIPFALGLIWTAFDPRKRGFHDHVAGTLVLRRRPGGVVAANATEPGGRSPLT